MKFIIFFLLVAASIAILLLAYKKLFNSRKDVERVLKEDPKAQENYYHTKHKDEEEEKSLTMEERVQLSWEFLVNITDKVLNSFSKGDQEKVREAGIKMNKNGMTYQHDVNQEIKQNVSKVKSIALQKTKATQQTTNRGI